MDRARTSGRVYVLTWVALALLTVGSFGASQLHLGSWDVLVSMAIAIIKSTLVVLFFMHLAEQPVGSRLAVVVSLLLVGIFILLTCLDVATRHTFPVRPELPGESDLP